MRFARIVERGNRQVLLTTDFALEGDGYIVIIETHYQGDQFVSLYIQGFATRDQAFDAMHALSDDEVMQNISNVIDIIAEGEGQ